MNETTFLFKKKYLKICWNLYYIKKNLGKSAT